MRLSVKALIATSLLFLGHVDALPTLGSALTTPRLSTGPSHSTVAGSGNRTLTTMNGRYANSTTSTVITSTSKAKLPVTTSLTTKSSPNRGSASAPNSRGSDSAITPPNGNSGSSKGDTLSPANTTPTRRVTSGGSTGGQSGNSGAQPKQSSTNRPAVPSSKSSPVGGNQAPGGNLPPAAITVFITVTAPPVCAATASPGSPAQARSSGLSGSNSSGGSGRASNGASSTGSGMNGSNSGSQIPASPSTTGSALKTLLPAVHWDHPVDSLENLKPGDSHQLYYTSSGTADPNVEHLFASLSTTLQHQTVILDHSSFIKSVACSDGGILVMLTNKEAFEYASEAWSAVPEFVLATNTNGCDSDDSQRTFWLISGITSNADSLSILAKVEKEIAIESSLDFVDLVWGTYHPPGSNSTGVPLGGASNSSPGGSGSNSGNSGSNSGNSGSGSGYSGSSTNSTSNGAACGNAPTAQIDGFLTAPCGAADFDEALDNALGYYDVDGSSDYASSIKDFAPGVIFDGDDLEDDDPSSFTDGSDATKRHLQKRDYSNWLKKGLNASINAFKTVVGAPLKLAGAGIKAIPAVDNLFDKLTTYHPKIGPSTTDVNLGPKEDRQTPWGPAKVIFQSEKASSSGKASADIALYCVDCGIKGHVIVAGGATWSTDGVKALNANLKADLTAGLHLGLVAAAKYSDTKTKPLLKEPIPNLGIAIKGLFAAGVSVSVDAVAKFNVQAQGQMLVGVAMLFPRFEANLDLVGDGSKITGYEPQFKKTFNASGSITAEARISLPVSFNVGIEIFPIGFKKAIALIEEPSLYGNVSFAASSPGAPPASETCNNGFAYFANAQNDVKLDLFGQKTIKLNHYDSPPLLSGCKKIDGGNPGSDSSEGSDDPKGSGNPSNESGGGGGGENGDPNEPQGDGTPGNTEGDGEKETGSETSETDSTPGKRFAKFGRRQNSTSHNNAVIADDGDISFNPSADSGSDSDGAESDRNSALTALDAAENAGENDGLTYTTIVEIHNVFALVPGDDGNLYAGDVSTGANNGEGLFGTYNGAAAVDDGARILHYYPDTMAAYGVSRIRLGEEDKLPKGSDMVVLQPLDTDGVKVLYATSTKGDVFALVLCDFDNGADSKLFIVADSTGMDNLMLEKLRYTVTGASVTQCDPVALKFGQASS